MKRSDILKPVLVAQAAAAHPQNSVWVSANAGSGKTHVLTERVIRLLLNGTQPARILCLTYTKAAAAEMQTRIFRTLSSWTEFDDIKLSEQLYWLEDKKPDAKRLAIARRLFARALETPGGLKIQTIHAFCEALLHQFPLEANIAGHFVMMDDVHRIELWEKARRAILEKAYLNKNTALHGAFMLILKTVGEAGLDSLLNEAIQKRQDLKPFLTKIMGQNGQAQLEQALNISEDDTLEVLTKKIRDTAMLSPEILQKCLEFGHSFTLAFVTKLIPLAEATTTKDIIDIVSSAYFTAGKPRVTNYLISKNLREQMPTLDDILTLKMDSLQELLEKYRCLKLVPLNMAAFQLCAALLERYEALKKSDGLLDFDDLIARTLNLLRRDGAGQWVQYKLDRGIDHILVDEAQDTSPSQWQIVQLLSQEFFVGDGQRDVARTVFAVGDEKQSIYSFQGAKPEDFDANGRLMKQRVEAVGRKFSKLRLDFSFRSTADVLKSVDLVFEKPENYRGLSAENIKTVHEAIRKDDIGEMVIWDTITPNSVDEPDDWRLPVDQLQAPAVQLAENIANTIAGWLKNGEMLEGKSRLMKASDIMVLVRKRDQFVPALARALKNRDVPVAGADRLHLTKHIAVRDLLALARIVLQPQDDLSLASILKSPLLGLDEDDLYELSAHRQYSLMQSLRDKSQNNERFALAFEMLTKYRSLADKMPVFEFYSQILSEDGGRRKILARLGTEASDVLDAFMDHTISIQKTGLPGLQAFVETLETAAPEIKRELDQNRSEVRIMTVHASKGLEGAVVFLVDSGSRVWNARHEPKLIDVPFGQQKGLIWQPLAEYKTSIGTSVIDGLKMRAEEEYRRLLYVGMTRAEDRLIVCGYRGKVDNKNTWATLVGEAIKPHAKEIAGPTKDIKAWRYQINETRKRIDHNELRETIETPITEMPGFLRHKMPPEADLPKPLTPSNASVYIDDQLADNPDYISISPVLGESNNIAPFAIMRGNLIHKLLQYLPDCTSDQREPMALAYLNKNASDWSDREKIEMVDNVIALLEEPLLQQLFSKQSRAEVSLMGIVKINGQQRAVSGQIDRLTILEDQIIIADFKTGRVPASQAMIPKNYLMQMALYRQLVGMIHKDKTIITLLIYSEGPKVFELNSEKLDEIVYS